MAFSEPHCPQKWIFYFCILQFPCNWIISDLCRDVKKNVTLSSNPVTMHKFYCRYCNTKVYFASIFSQFAQYSRSKLCFSTIWFVSVHTEKWIFVRAYLSFFLVVLTKKRASVWARVCYYGKGIIDCLLLYKVYQCCHKCKQAEKLLTVFAQTFICDKFNE